MISTHTAIIPFHSVFHNAERNDFMSRRNPNGYGCVTKSSGKRSRPYAVKVTVYDQEGHARQTPVAYAPTKTEALILLARYNDNPWEIDREKVTLAVLYQRWLKIKAPKTRNFNTKFPKISFQSLFKILRPEIPFNPGLSDAGLY